MDRIPSLRRKSNGAYFVRWGGKDHSLGSDLAEAQRRLLDPEHPGGLHAWRAWREGGPAPATRRELLVVDAAERWLAHYTAQGRPHAAATWSARIARFLTVHGAHPLRHLAETDPRRGRHLPAVLAYADALKRDLLAEGYAPNTINGDLSAIRCLLTWCAAQGLCAPVSWAGRAKCPQPVGEPNDLPAEGIDWLLRIAARTDPAVHAWMLAGYLTLVRASELPRLVAAWSGDRSAGWRLSDALGADPRGLLVELSVHKTSWRGRGLRRIIVISEPASAALDAARDARRWSRPDSWSAALRQTVGIGPSVLRDSAASGLRTLGVDLADVDLLLGHEPPGVWRSYARIAWPGLRAAAARLAGRSAP